MENSHQYMINHFLLAIAVIALLYSLTLLATIPFLVYFGRPKKWQKMAEFLMSFPIDNEKFGFFSFPSAVIAIFLNGLFWGTVLACAGGLVAVLFLVK